jgi:L-alanine-DL-glutamate epimerase-like enolase superfamily enzyme
MATATRADVEVDGLAVGAYTIPTDRPEQDGTLDWDSTTIVVVEARSGGHTGIGWTYGPEAAAALVASKLAQAVKGRSALDVQGAWAAMNETLRQAGQVGVAAMAISAVDVALWDLKAKLLDVCLADLLGRARPAVPVYGSGGLTSYSEAQLCAQLSDWVAQGIPRVKMKVGRDPAADVPRAQAARAAIGSDAELFVDANGAYGRKQALMLAERFRGEADVTWFEEPVSSNDLDGLRLIRDGAPPGMDITAGEYGFTPEYFRAMLDAGAVDVLQADVTRCCGISGLLATGDLCAAYEVPLSAHCSPQIHAHAAAAIGRLRHCEYFHTHARAEAILFDGALAPRGDGCLHPDASRTGLGIELKRADAGRYAL